jgi:hypothetical protein
MWQQMLSTDLAEQVPRLDLPPHLFHGAYDYTCSYPLARSYFEHVEAPLTGFYTFDDAARSPLFEEPGKARRSCRKMWSTPGTRSPTLPDRGRRHALGGPARRVSRPSTSATPRATVDRWA